MGTYDFDASSFTFLDARHSISNSFNPNIKPVY